MNLRGEESRDLLIKMLPYLKTFMGRDLMACVTDREKFLAYAKGDKIDVGIKEGDDIPQEANIRKAMQKKETIIDMVPKEVYGVTFKDINTPVFDEKGAEVIGCVSVGLSMATEKEIMEVAENLKSSFEQAASSAQEISASANEVTSEQQNLDDDIKEITDKIYEINNVLGFLHKLARSSKMLGLNASIEAARAGEQGKGFMVVAEEIQKFSEQSMDLSNKIEDLTTHINEKIDEIKQRSEKTLSYVHEQASSTEEISASIQELASISQELENLTSKL